MLKWSQELSVRNGAAARFCGAWSNSQQISRLTFVLPWLVGLFAVTQGSLPFAVSLCWVGREESKCFAASTPPFHYPIKSVNGISIFPSSAKPLVFCKIKTCCTLLGLILNIRQGGGFLTIGGALINLVYRRRLGKSAERFTWYCR